jgi:predicted metallopeptidase
MGIFSSEFLENIKKSINALYDRDIRLKINGENFWIVEKDMLVKHDKLSNEELTQTMNHSLLVHLPHTIPFTLRAKVFQHLTKCQQQEYSIYTHPISINRSLIFEDAFHKIYQ